MKFEDIQFNEKDHRYFYHGQELFSATTFIGRFKKPFDGPFNSLRSAFRKTVDESLYRATIAELTTNTYSELYRLLHKMGKLNSGLMMEAVELGASWSRNGTESAAYGTRVHAELENYNRTGQLCEDATPEAQKYVEWIDSLSRKPEIIAIEQPLGDVKLGLAGTPDLRTVNNGVHRTPDYKTNKKFRFKSEYGDYYLPPFDDLPVCEFTTYSLQTSLYCLFIERHEEVETKPGPLIWLPRGKKLQIIQPADYRDRWRDFFAN